MKLSTITPKTLLALACTTLVVGCGGPSVYPETVDKAKINKQPFIIWSASPSSPDSAGGVSLDIRFTNTAPETIKYIRYTVRGYNSVGDPAGGEIRASSYRTLRDVGPHRPDVTETTHWGELYYNWSLECVQITKLTLEYLNGKKKTYTGKALSALFGPNYRRTCKIT